ncbi:MAG: PAC2 family protein [Candidatus Bathyarchaeota archaeon]|nr:PAC2 family protein [Candidatus Bathyarchaeota archaeon]
MLKNPVTSRESEGILGADIWIEHLRKVDLERPVAVVGSPGLRSIGELVVNQLVEKTRAELIAELYSTHLPLVYQTKPSYASHYALPGIGGAKVKNGLLDLPKVKFYACSDPSLIITKGYHANFAGQFDVADEVVGFLSESGAKRIIVAAGYGSKTRKVCCAATDLDLIREMKEKFEIEVEYEGPFYGFSGLVFGLAKRKGVDALCLFAGTEPNLDDPEFPDPKSSELILDALSQMLAFKK